MKKKNKEVFVDKYKKKKEFQWFKFDINIKSLILLIVGFSAFFFLFTVIPIVKYLSIGTMYNSLWPYLLISLIIVVNSHGRGELNCAFNVIIFYVFSHYLLSILLILFGVESLGYLINIKFIIFIPLFFIHSIIAYRALEESIFSYIYYLLCECIISISIMTIGLKFNPDFIISYVDEFSFWFIYVVLFLINRRVFKSIDGRFFSNVAIYLSLFVIGYAYINIQMMSHNYSTYDLGSKAYYVIDCGGSSCSAEITSCDNCEYEGNYSLSIDRKEKFNGKVKLIDKDYKVYTFNVNYNEKNDDYDIYLVEK